LNTYRLRPIPDWAIDGMKKSVATEAENYILQQNLTPMILLIEKDLQKRDQQGAGAGVTDAATKDWMTYTAYLGEANQLANELVRPTARGIANNIAEEWVKRPWPYEIRSPVAEVPPSRGMNPDDRRLYFTMFATAQSTDATAPKFAFPKIFGGYDWKLVAYAQAETFNWMEFNSSYGSPSMYGGAGGFDSINWVPEVSHLTAQLSSFKLFAGAPRAWRVCSLGGWEWRPRLTLSDTLNAQLAGNPDMVTMFQEGGFSVPMDVGDGAPGGKLLNASALDEVNLH
jgi:hypothetical protein